MPDPNNPLTGRHAPEPGKQFYSVGCLCGLLQILPDQLDTMMEAAGVEYAWTFDGVGVLRGDDIVKLRDVAKQVSAEATLQN